MARSDPYEYAGMVAWPRVHSPTKTYTLQQRKEKAMAKTPTKTEELIERIQREAMAVTGPDPSRIQAILTETLAQPGDWLDARYQEPGDGDYALYPLYRAENRRCSILSAVIRPEIPLPRLWHTLGESSSVR
jgi:hypothetical protein